MLLTRLNVDGSFDRSFHGNGRARIRFLGTRTATAEDIELDTSGRMLAAGHAEPNPFRRSSRASFALAAVQPDGTLDPAFSADGVRRSRFRPRGDEYGYGLALTATGDLVVGGVSTRGTRRGAFRGRAL